MKLVGFFLMLKMNAVYAWLAVFMMAGIYVWITNSNKNKQMMSKVFQGVIFQVTRWMQIFLQIY